MHQVLEGVYAMNEKPILFSSPMVRAILDGRKTQTRRIIKDAHGAFWDHAGYRPSLLNGQIMGWEPLDGGPPIEEGSPRPRCPYGFPGGRLWVRENFYVMPDLWAENHGPQPIHYAADVADRNQVEDYASKPSIHMPRWASRVTLLVKSVRVERVQDITEDDARREGAPRQPIDCVPREKYRSDFQYLWERINGPESWASNPWVWVVEFERVKP